MFASIRRPLTAFVLMFLCAVAGLPQQGTAQGAKGAEQGPVIFAAASMKTALDAMASAFAAETGQAPKISYASSGVLAKQIVQGAPADIFISANDKWMDYLEKAELLKPGTRRDLLSNALVLIEPVDAQTNLKIAPGFALAKALGAGKLAVCTVASCPAGIYAKEALVKLGIFEEVEPKLAQAENVRSALLLVARGEAPFGIVYATDAKAEPKVKVVDTFPASSHKPIIYPVAILVHSTDPAAANFVAFMTSQAAVKILTDQGFIILTR